MVFLALGTAKIAIGTQNPRALLGLAFALVDYGRFAAATADEAGVGMGEIGCARLALCSEYFLRPVELRMGDHRFMRTLPRHFSVVFELCRKCTSTGVSDDVEDAQKNSPSLSCTCHSTHPAREHDTTGAK